MERGGVDAGRDDLPVLALCRAAGAVANLLGTLSLLFANAFGAIATAYALTGSSLNIVPILLYAQIRGDVLQNPGLGAALALGMVVITGACQHHLSGGQRPRRAVAAMKSTKLWAWIVFALGALYFLGR